LNRLIKEFFEFSKRERRGIIVLLCLILVLIVTNLVVNYRINKKQIDFSEFEKEIDEWYASDTAINISEVELFYFDPNTASREQFLQLGIPDFVADNIISYRKKGGKFKNPNDFARIYGLEPEIFDILHPYISIQQNSRNSYKQKSNTDTEYELKDFNPNTASKNELLSIGFKPYIAGNLIKYRNSGAVFYKKSDLLKLYGMDSIFYIKIEPYIVIDTTNIISDIEEDIDELLIIEINAAEANDLMKIKGIGAVYSDRIIKYRNLLGGFVSVNQLTEVYGINPETIDIIKNQIIIDSSLVNCININTADFTSLIRHPYIEKENVQAILNYRKLVGKFEDKSELLSQKVISEELYSKLSPYICVE
jgi:competence ComEA-like helix-hairpin-helix protein